MTRTLKIDVVLVAIMAALVVMLLTVDAASRAGRNASLLGAKVLAETRGASPNYVGLDANGYCACLLVAANPGLGAVCDCTTAQMRLRALCA